MTAATTCELQWTYISIAIGGVALVAAVLFSDLLFVSSVLTRRQRLLNMTLRRQLRAARLNQEKSSSEVEPPHPIMSNSNQWQHLSRCISEEPVYADVHKEDDMAMTTENVGYEQISGNLLTTENVEQTSGNVMTTDNVAHEQISGNVMTTDNVAYEQNSGNVMTTDNVA